MPAGLVPGAVLLALPVLAPLALAVLELAPLTPGIRSCVASLPRELVHVKHLMQNQRGVKMCLGTAEIALPKKPA